jgi:hypothetical protein
MTAGITTAARSVVARTTTSSATSMTSGTGSPRASPIASAVRTPPDTAPKTRTCAASCGPNNTSCSPILTRAGPRAPYAKPRKNYEPGATTKTSNCDRTSPNATAHRTQTPNEPATPTATRQQAQISHFHSFGRPVQANPGKQPGDPGPTSCTTGPLTRRRALRRAPRE